MSIAVIVVNYGTPDLSIKAVESVLAHGHAGRDVEIHLVDNASPGGDAHLLKDAHTRKAWGDKVVLWLETENRGFGRGNNVVLEALNARETPPEFVFLLNPDAELENEVVDILAKELETDPKGGVVGAGISLPDGSATVGCFRFPSMFRELLTTLDFGPFYKLFPTGRVSMPPDTPGGPVDWVAGAAMMMRFRALREAGFFDPDFFLYYEEVELTHRLRRAGYTVRYVPRARVIHIGGAATKVNSQDTRRRRRPDYVYHSWRLYFQKVHGRGYALLTAVLKVPAALLNDVHTRFRRKRPRQPVGFYRDHWRYVLRPLLMGTQR